jgi:eukaryotic-like serine/threonine-protein kinase
MVTRSLDHYFLEKLIGSGGMGAVWVARDEQLGRRVAIKLLNPGTFSDQTHRLRFRREAQAASALAHPNIVTIHEIGSFGGDDFIVMELVEGGTLSDVISPGGLDPEQAVSYGIQIASAVATAHRAGIVHRDIKPANLLLTNDGCIKLADFGLAKMVSESPDDASTATLLTRERAFLGTPGYASPEQIRGDVIDARTDVFAIGCVLYELLTGRRAFAPAPGESIFQAVLADPPVPPHTLRPDTPRDLERIILRALEKTPAARYPSAAEMVSDLEAVRARLEARRVSLLHVLQRPGIRVAVVVLALAVVVTGALAWQRWRTANWIGKIAIPEATAFLERGEGIAAFRLLRRAEALAPRDPWVRELMREASIETTIRATAPGTDIYFRSFDDPPQQWEHLGRSPLKVRLPAGNAFLLKGVRDGYLTRQMAAWGTASMAFIPLSPSSGAPAGMVPIPGSRQAFFEVAAEVNDFWIDEFEVTNRDFLPFVRSGGYEREELWIGTPAELRPGFVDRTGRVGPSTWDAGSPPEGRLDHPVGGISWYEARAYCRSLGKELPTLFHWYAAAHPGAATQWAHLSNFAADETVPVGDPRAANTWGTYDMAGNIREWALSDAGDGRRSALGGSYREASYTFWDQWAEPAGSREPNLGCRCAKYEGPLSEAEAGPVIRPFRDYRMQKPAGAEAFSVIESVYSYERTPLDARIEAVDDSAPHFRLQKISYAAASGGERVRAFLLLPKDVRPPWQTVVWFPGAGRFVGRHEFNLDGETTWFLFLLRSGRAVFVPEYYGSFARATENFTRADNWQRILVSASRDLRRGVDYLETRSDIDGSGLAYYGLSMGAGLGPVMTALEPRFRASVLLGGGLYFWQLTPAVDAFNFAPRVRVPTLMINGKHDYYFAYETSQKPLFENLGTAEKRHVVFESGHLPAERDVWVGETLDWLDRYLGKVSTR